MQLITTPNLDAPDDFYESLIEAHRDLSDEQSHALNARLVLVLANHVGSLPILQQALQVARMGATGVTPSNTSGLADSIAARGSSSDGRD